MEYECHSSSRTRLDSNRSNDSNIVIPHRRGHRVRLHTEAIHASFSQTDCLIAFQENVRNRSRTTNLEEEKNRNIDFDESILGMVRIITINTYISLAIGYNLYPAQINLKVIVNTCLLYFPGSFGAYKISRDVPIFRQWTL